MTAQIRGIASGALAALAVLLVVFAALTLVAPEDVSSTEATIIGVAGNALAGVVGGAVGARQAKGSGNPRLVGFAGPVLLTAIALAALGTQGSSFWLVQVAALAAGAWSGVWMAER